MPRLRESVDWTVSTLPAINPFFEVFFFGGKTGNLNVEQQFSTFGNHIEDEDPAVTAGRLVADGTCG